jgi:uncharacterized repeat protein (TIGR03803 family)
MRNRYVIALMLAGVAPTTVGGTAARAEDFSVLYSFMGTPDGELPDAALINVGGTLYGTTLRGGANNYGSVFTITPAGAESVLYSFVSGADGAFPEASLTNVDGALYGTTNLGGVNECGTVFKVTAAGAETVLYAFKCEPNDGDGPEASLINVGGALYGTTYAGGTADRGTVFKVTRSGKETVLHSFGGTGDGQYPEAGLINVDGTLYGTTAEGGANDLGTVFAVTPAGVESVLYAFKSGSDANTPVAPLLDVGGTLYGTSEFGGGNLCEKETTSCGAVFTVTLKGVEKVLYSFLGRPPAAELLKIAARRAAARYLS